MPIAPQIVITPDDIITKDYAISSVTYTPTTATYTASGHTLVTGNIVIVSGINPVGYNGTFTITGTTSTTFTVANTTNLPIIDGVGDVFWCSNTDFDYEDLDTNYTADADDIETIDYQLAEIEIAVNGKNKIYRQATAPSGDLTEGDVWFDTDDDNIQYYWTGSAWVSVRDLGVQAAEDASAAATAAAAAATAAASAAQTTADGKNKIYRQGTTPSGSFSVGDLWFDTANDNRIARWDGSSWVQYGLGNAAIANLDAGKITTGYLAADRIQANTLDANKLTAGTVTATQIATGTITSEKIATGTIVAGNIAGGTITGDQIAVGTITAYNIDANTITAAEIEVGSITVDRLQVGTLTGFTIRTSGNSARVELNAGSGSLRVIYGSAVKGHVLAASNASEGIIMHAGSSPNSGSTTYGLVNLQPSYALMAAASTRYIEITTADVVISGPTYVITSFYNQNSTTTSSTANTFMNSSTGLTVRSTASSQRYKENIVDIRTVPDLDPRKLLTLPVRAFSYKTDYLSAEDDRAETLMPGFIAEEVDQIYPIGADYIEGPESWNDRIIVPALLALIQDQEVRIQALEGK